MTSELLSKTYLNVEKPGTSNPVLPSGTTTSGSFQQDSGNTTAVRGIAAPENCGSVLAIVVDF
jgi:hypothetical protein